MRAEAFELIRLKIPLQTAFGHAAHTREVSDGYLVLAYDAAGRVGLGEVQARSYVTGEDPEQVPELFGALASPLLDRELTHPDLDRARQAADRKLACFGGLELALLDLEAQAQGVPLGEFLGPLGPELPAGVVIGFEVATADLKKHCAMLRFKGRHHHVKVKVGHPEDRARLEVISQALGGLPLRLDANGEWTADEAVHLLRGLAGIPIHSVEQPVAAADVAGMARVRRESGLKVMADESVVTLADARALFAAQAVDYLYIRLGKVGGLLGARALMKEAEAAGVGCLLGTMVGETGVLSTATELFGRRVPGFPCLDGKGQNRHLLVADPVVPAQDSKGLGLSVEKSLVLQYGVGSWRYGAPPRGHS